MSKFKVGDKIAVYGHGAGTNHNLPVRVVTTVTHILHGAEEGLLYTDDRTSFKKGSFDFSVAHEKQCRKIKPSRSPRRLFASIPDYNCFSVTGYFDRDMLVRALPKYKIVEFVEVPCRKEKP